MTEKPSSIFEVIFSTEGNDPQPFKLDFSAFSLIFANFLPVFGGIFFGWDIRGILMVYWAENLVIGFYNVLKMALIKQERNESKFFVIPFFIFHFGGFCAGHGLFIMLFMFSGLAGGDYDFDPTGDAFDWPGPLVFLGLFINVVTQVWAMFGWSVGLPVLALFISHGISFKQNFIDKKEYENRSLGEQMFAPYIRIVIMHVSIIFAAVPIFLLGSPMPLLVLLVIFKTVVDLYFHWLSHRTSKTE